MTSVFYDWKFLPLEPLHLHLLSLPSGNCQFVLCIYEFGFILFCLLFALLFRFYIVSEIIWYLSVSDLFHFSVILSGSICIVTNVKMSFFLWLSIISLCVCVCVCVCITSSVSIYPPKNTVVVSISWLL